MDDIEDYEFILDDGIEPSKNKPGPFRCSFCGKWQREVKKIIAGPSVYICDECVELCFEIVKEEKETI